jgi:hypothetical protein
MAWQKLGRIYEPRAKGPKLTSHAANPLAVHLAGDVYRVFFSGRDAQKRSSVGWFDLDMASPRVVAECDGPVFLHGPDGSFYSHGVSVGCCYETAGARYIIFMGWHIPDGGHWRGEIGRLRLDADLSLHLDPERPILAVDAHDPVSLSYPWVSRVGGHYRMWYGSTSTWDAGNGEMLHVVRQAHSADGQDWKREDNDLPHEIGVAQAFSRPTVICSHDGSCRMWFSYRSGSGETYCIGHARSPDGVNWTLDLDAAGIGVSASGWDSEMIEYPFVFAHGGQRYMLYNGNGYGLTGIGLAVERE